MAVCSSTHAHGQALDWWDCGYVVVCAVQWVYAYTHSAVHKRAEMLLFILFLSNIPCIRSYKVTNTGKTKQTKRTQYIVAKIIGYTICCGTIYSGYGRLLLLYIVQGVGGFSRCLPIDGRSQCLLYHKGRPKNFSLSI